MKVEDAIARATTPAPMSQEDQDLREQVIFQFYKDFENPF